MKKKIKYTPGQAKLKIEAYCAYQERSHFEVKEKLYAWGLYSNDVNAIIASLIEQNFLNEERFAEAFVSGKFNIKYWGRIKIKHALIGKKVSPANIKLALSKIDDDAYVNKLALLANKKNKTITEKNILKRKQKLLAYLAGKGFENDLIHDCLTQLFKNHA